MATVVSGSAVVVTERQGRPGATLQIQAPGVLSSRLSVRNAIDIRNALTTALKNHADARLIEAVENFNG